MTDTLHEVRPSCTQCGATLRGGTRFCPACGVAVESVPANHEAEAPAEAASEPVRPESAATKTSPSQRRTLAIGGAIAAAVVVLAIVMSGGGSGGSGGSSTAHIDGRWQDVKNDVIWTFDKGGVQTTANDGTPCNGIYTPVSVLTRISVTCGQSAGPYVGRVAISSDGNVAGVSEDEGGEGWAPCLVRPGSAAARLDPSTLVAQCDGLAEIASNAPSPSS